MKKVLVWVDNKPVVRDMLPEDMPQAPSLEQQQDLRARTYKNESDPIFFKWQRGEVTEQEWLDKVEEIKLRYPYPEVVA
jgi:hypothetical protein